MKLVNEKEKREFQLINTKKPKMRHINGKTWVTWTDIIVNGKVVSVRCDTTWAHMDI